MLCTVLGFSDNSTRTLTDYIMLQWSSQPSANCIAKKIIIVKQAELPA